MKYFELLENYDPDYREGPASIVTCDGISYQLDTILRLIRFKPIVEFDLKHLAWMLDGDTVDGSYGTADYNERELVADLTVPIIVTVWKGQWLVLDGMHRLSNANKQGLTTLPAKIVHSIILGMAEIKA